MLGMEDPIFLRLLNRIQILEDDYQVEVDKRIHLDSRLSVIITELVSASAL